MIDPSDMYSKERERVCVFVCVLVCVYVWWWWWILEKMRDHKENTSISAQQKWEDGITDVPEAKKGKM